MKVYILQDDFDYKNHIMKYRPIVTLNPQDGFKVAGTVRNARGQSILSIWEAPEVKPIWEEPEKPVADISFIGVTGPITVNGKAHNALKDLLESSGELLPLKSEEGEFFIHNVTTVIDAFDYEKSVYKWQPTLENEAIGRLCIFSFQKRCLENAVAFRFPKYLGDCFYTDIFKRRVEEADLKGALFQLIWDSEDPDYHDERYSLEQWERIKEMHARGA